MIVLMAVRDLCDRHNLQTTSNLRDLGIFQPPFLFVQSQIGGFFAHCFFMSLMLEVSAQPNNWCGKFCLSHWPLTMVPLDFVPA